MSASAAEVGRKVICADGWRVTMHVEVRRGPLQGPDSERQGPTNRMSAAMFSGSPHSTRATTPDRTERPSHLRSSRRSDRNAKVGAVSQHQDQPSPRDAATANQRLMTLPLPPLQADRT
jgi:hypothetical protein